MFLSGQMFENAATTEAAPEYIANHGHVMYHGKSVEIKDRLNRFRTVDENIWNNPYRATSNKIRNFYHTKDQEFKCKLLWI